MWGPLGCGRQRRSGGTRNAEAPARTTPPRPVPQPHPHSDLLAVSPDTKPIAAMAVAAVGAGAVVYAGVQAKKLRDGAAVIELYNTLVRGPGRAVLLRAPVSGVQASACGEAAGPGAACSRQEGRGTPQY